MNINWDLETFLENGHFNNFMTKRICGKDDPDLAIQYLKEKFKFVGLVENFDESLLLMKNELNLKSFNMHYEIKNVNVKKAKNEISAKIIEMVPFYSPPPLS